MQINKEKLNWLRIEKGYSISKLASESKISKATISRLLRDEVKTRPDTIGKIAKALNVEVKELFFED